MASQVGLAYVSPYDAILSGCGFKDGFGMEGCDAQEHLGGSAGGPLWVPGKRESLARGGVRPAPHFFADSFSGIEGRQECVWRDAKHCERDARAPQSLLSWRDPLIMSRNRFFNWGSRDGH
jgi:hypothetical protein